MSELYHYGVKGMKWGVRKQVESSQKQRQIKAITEYSPNNKISGRISDYSKYNEGEKASIRSNRLEFIFGKGYGDTGAKRTAFDPKTGKSFTVNVYRNQSDTAWDIEAKNRGTYRVYDDTDDYEKMLAFIFGYDEEDAKEIIEQADSDWIEAEKNRKKKQEEQKKKNESEKRARERKIERDIQDALSRNAQYESEQLAKKTYRKFLYRANH